MIKPFYLVVS